jgi:hypothetical protein
MTIKTVGSWALVLLVCGFAGMAAAEEAVVDEAFDLDAAFFASLQEHQPTAQEKFALQTFMERRDAAVAPGTKVCATPQVYKIKPAGNAGEFIHLQTTAQSTCGDCSNCLSAASCNGCLIGSTCGTGKTCNVVGCPPPSVRACCGCS